METALAPQYVSYLRKSKGRKAVRQQRTLTRAYVDRQHGQLLHEFRDDDQTAFQKIGGARPVRDDFTAMLAMLKANPGLRLVAYHADRLTRNDQDTAQLIEVCAASRNPVETISGGTYDLGNANGRKRLRDDASAAIYEVDHMTERVLEGRAVVVADGRWLGGRRPFGWELDPAPLIEDDDGQLVPWLDEDGKPVRGILRLRQAEADALKTAMLDVLSGKRKAAAIARDWNAAGIVTSGGIPWNGNEVKRVLCRARNAGLLEHRGEVLGPATWPGVVDETTWRAVRAILTDPDRRTSPGPQIAHLLSFLARCGVCGEPVICTATRHRNDTKRAVYRCRAGTRGHVARDEAALDEYVTELVIAVVSRRDAARLLIPRAEPGEDLGRLYEEARAIQELMTERDKLHRNRVITTKELVDGRAQLSQELAEVQARIAEAGQDNVLVPLVRSRDPRALWNDLTLTQRRDVIRRLFDITLDPVTAKGRPPGWRAGDRYFRPGSVTVTPKWGTS